MRPARQLTAVPEVGVKRAQLFAGDAGEEVVSHELSHAERCQRKLAAELHKRSAEANIIRAAGHGSVGVRA